MHAVPDIPEPDSPDDVKPYVELVHGRRIPKVSPKLRHRTVQLRVGAALLEWAGKEACVATELRTYLLPEHGKPSSLVPDVAFVSRARLEPLAVEAREKPPFAPDIAVEIWSPGDQRGVLGEKIDLYFSYGARLVIVVDPEARTIAMHEPGVTHAFGAGEIAATGAFPGLRLDVSDLLR
jgi:Uma2 family endonuclease